MGKKGVKAGKRATGQQHIRFICRRQEVKKNYLLPKDSLIIEGTKTICSHITIIHRINIIRAKLEGWDTEMPDKWFRYFIPGLMGSMGGDVRM